MLLSNSPVNENSHLAEPNGVQQARRVRPQPHLSALKKKDRLRCSILGPGSIFGEMDVLLGRKSSYTARCTSTEGEVYAFPAADFLRMIKTDQLSWERTKATATNKEISHMQMAYKKELSQRRLLTTA